MALLICPGKRLKKKKPGKAEEILAKLDGYLKDSSAGPAKILCGFWKDQQDAITYQELREAVKAGALDESTFRLWQQDYSVLAAGKLNDVWEHAMEAGAANQPLTSGLPFAFNTQTPGVRSWIQERGAAFVTASTAEQKNAIAALLSKKMVEGHTVDELARMIRPCIGLTEGQAKANARYYDSIVANLKKEHPRMKQESIQRKAQDAAMKYAERQHRYRAMTVAMTESAFAYNRGADEGVRQAQAQGLLGTVKKRWCTSGDDQVCSVCQGLEGVELGMDDGFQFKGGQLFAGQNLMPPAHPRCACAVEYIEVESLLTTDVPQMAGFIMGDDSYKFYDEEEIQNMAKQMDEIASRHVSSPSGWSGNIVIDNDNNPGKLWNCDIRTPNDTAPHMILHEQLHARSISLYKAEEAQALFLQYRNIEEAAVQFMAQEISLVENIEIIGSMYDKMADALREIRRCAELFGTDYEFAKILIEKPVSERLLWLENQVYDKMSLKQNTTLEDYQKVSDLLNMLYTEV